MDAAGGAAGDARPRRRAAARPERASRWSCSWIAPGREAGLGSAIRDQSPSGEHGLRLRLEAASFDVLIAWLASLQQQHGVSVDAATIDAGTAPGLVNASLTLVHGAAPGP